MDMFFIHMKSIHEDFVQHNHVSWLELGLESGLFTMS